MSEEQKIPFVAQASGGDVVALLLADNILAAAAVMEQTGMAAWGNGATRKESGVTFLILSGPKEIVLEFNKLLDKVSAEFKTAASAWCEAKKNAPDPRRN